MRSQGTSSTVASETSFYVTGGTLRHDTPSYVERQADADLYKGLKRSEFCYVLTSRQMGKSSLMNRTAARLREDGVAVVILDFTGIGQNLSPEQWYGGLLERFAWAEGEQGEEPAAFPGAEAGQRFAAHPGAERPEQPYHQRHRRRGFLTRSPRHRSCTLSKRLVNDSSARNVFPRRSYPFAYPVAQ
jgi:AAA domain-containing protein